MTNSQYFLITKAETWLELAVIRLVAFQSRVVSVLQQELAMLDVLDRGSLGRIEPVRQY